jgi:hypothetical protein
VQRISVLGTSGSGKTTLARRLSEALDLPHLELDAVYHRPGWTPLPTDEFRSRVGDFVRGDRWVVCGKYSKVRDLVLARADTVVCLDHNRLRQTARVAGRTVRRASRREELWNGNRESWRGLWPFGDPENTVVGWTWRNVPRARALFDELERMPPHGELSVIRLRGWHEVDQWFASATAC